MAIQFIQDGQTVDYLAINDDYPAGYGIFVNTLFGVTTRAIKKGELGSIVVDGIFEFPKPTDEAIYEGTPVFLHVAENYQVAHAASEPLAFQIGIAVARAELTDTTVRVKLVQPVIGF